MGIFNEFFKKEKPVFTGLKFGFGSGGGAAAAGGSGINASGGTKTTNGSYTVHTFSYPNSDNFQVSSGEGEIFYLVVAGGGGGSNATRGGGGGAGGCRSNHPSVPSPLRASSYTITPGTYPVTVGQGGLSTYDPSYSSPEVNRNGAFNTPLAPPTFPGYGESGGNSSFNAPGVNGYDPIESTGGGGGNNGPAGNPDPGARGGSGGGGGDWDGAVPEANVAIGNYPVTSPPQGNPGGATKPGTGPYVSGGGGGWGGAGEHGSTGRGGASVEVTISGSPTTPAGEYYGGGGQGSGNGIPGSTENDPVGKSGGQVNSPLGAANGVNGTGGGGAARSGGDGGHGVVIISYLT